MDLYRHAADLPRTAFASLTATTYQDLRSGLTPGQIRWRRERGSVVHPHHGVYLSGQGEPQWLDRAHAALAAAPPLAMLGFHTAACLHGFGVSRTDTIHLMVPAGTPFPQRSGITAHQVVVPVEKPVDVLGLPCAPPERCAVDLARCLPRTEALPVLDAALQCGACDSQELEREVARHSGLRGVRQARELIPLADPRAECRQESQLRLLLHDAGLRGLVPQLPVLNDFGIPLFRIDLGDPEGLVGIEYDGESHLDRQRLRADRARHNWLQGRGWAMHYFTAYDLYVRPEAIVDIITTARRSRAKSRDWRSSRDLSP
jgi:very-short-patch-repair endonuclease